VRGAIAMHSHESPSEMPAADRAPANPPQVRRCPQTGLSLPECACPACTARQFADSGRGHLLDAFELNERARRGGRLPR
jgi:hypothetical protein